MPRRMLATPADGTHARSRHKPAAVSRADACPASTASSSSWCAPSRSPCRPQLENWSPPTRILPPSAAADARVRSASPRPPTSACLRSVAVHLADSNCVSVGSTLPGSALVEPEPETPDLRAAVDAEIGSPTVPWDNHVSQQRRAGCLWQGDGGALGKLAGTDQHRRADC